MNGLVFIESGRAVTDSLTVADVFKKDHRHVLRDIEVQLKKLSEAGEEKWGMSNFGRTQYQNEQNGQWYPKFNLTEDAFAIVVMAYVTPEAMKMKVKFLGEFKRMREELSRPRELTRLELIELARESELARIEESKKRIEAEQRASEYQFQLQEQAPKVLFADAVTTSHDTILIRDLAKVLKQNGIDIGAKRLFEELRERGFLIKQKSADYNSPTQRAMELGLFQIKETPIVHSDGHVTLSRTPKVTGKGQVYFVKLFKRVEGLSVSQ